MALLDRIGGVPRSGLTWDYNPLAGYFHISAIAQLCSEGLLDDGVTTTGHGTGGRERIR
jgi:hypothetical protein